LVLLIIYQDNKILARSEFERNNKQSENENFQYFLECR